MTNEDGRTPLDIARSESHDRIVAIILEREFQTGQTEEMLPSPPPTPPSAPPMELFQDACEEDVDSEGGQDEESFSEWRSRLRTALEKASNGIGGADGEEGDEVGDEDRIATIDVRITWKTFEEEAKELMNQLERLRMQEVEKVKYQIVKARKEGVQRIERLDRQSEVMQAQARELEASVPKTEKRYSDLAAAERLAAERSGALVEASERERTLLEALMAAQQPESPAPCAGEKAEALKRFAMLQAMEKEQLREEERRRMANVEQLAAKKDAEVAVAREKIRILGRLAAILVITDVLRVLY